MHVRLWHENLTELGVAQAAVFIDVVTVENQHPLFSENTVEMFSSYLGERINELITCDIALLFPVKQLVSLIQVELRMP